jgi:hypothetical protein
MPSSQAGSRSCAPGEQLERKDRLNHGERTEFSRPRHKRLRVQLSATKIPDEYKK